MLYWKHLKMALKTSGMPKLSIGWRATFRYRLKIPSRTPAFDDVTYFHVSPYHGYGADINIRTSKGNYTALFVAICNRHHKAVSFLLSKEPILL